MSEDREISFVMTVRRFGASGMLLATSDEVPNLRVTGTNEADLWDCLAPVITNLFEAEGKRVRSLTLDKSDMQNQVVRVCAQIAQES